MIKENVKIGMKVVPFQKTVATRSGLENSTCWRHARLSGQNYLYVVNYDESYGYFILSNSEHEKSGDFFNANDFEPFENVTKKENKPMKKEFDLGIKQVIYNPPATILVHNDGTKTVVKTTNNDEYDPIFGYLMAYFQKHSGLSKTQVGKLCDKIVEDFSKQQEKKNKPVIKDEFNEEYCF